ncbi:MAG: DUF2066 domain-containing protein [Pseudomonadota bacterium]
MRSLVEWLLIFVLISVPTLAGAVRVHSIYQDEVFVASQNSKDKSRALQDALTDVFIKVSGNSHVMDNNPNLKANLSRADKYVQQFSYSSPVDAPKTKPYLMLVRFDADAINRLLKEAGTPTWGQNRPLILVWLALQSTDHPLDIIDSSTDFQKLLRQSARQRGLPMIFPVMDVTDLSLVSVNDVTTPIVTNLQQASQRYDSGAMLIGSVKQVHDDFNSHWQLVLGSSTWNWDVSGKSLPDVFSGVVDDVADALATRYGLITTGDVLSELTLTISGIKQHEDLLSLMKYLQRLTGVSEVQLRSVSGNEIVLDLSLHGSRESFVQAASISKNLKPVTSANLADGGLEYKWIP